jgi:hypothetical protein
MLLFSPDSRRAYAAKTGPKWRVVADGGVGPLFDGIGEASLVFSPDSKRTAYAAIEREKQLVVVDDQPGPAYEGVRKPVSSPDGRHLAYPAKQHGQWMIVLDGHPGPSFAVVEGQRGPVYDAIVNGVLTFDSDGALTYFACKGGFLYRVRTSRK